MIEYEVACELHYAVHGPAEFVFNIHAARNSHQQVLKESFQIDGATHWSGRSAGPVDPPAPGGGKDQQTERNAVPGEQREVVADDVAQQPAHA